MTDERITAMHEVAAKVHQLEHALDEAYAIGGELMALLPRARRRAGFSSTVAHEALEGVSASMSSVTRAQNDLIGSHKQLEALRRRLCLPEVAGGDKDPVPKVARPTGLKAVA